MHWPRKKSRKGYCLTPSCIKHLVTDVVAIWARPSTNAVGILYRKEDIQYWTLSLSSSHCTGIVEAPVYLHVPPEKSPTAVKVIFCQWAAQHTLSDSPAFPQFIFARLVPKMQCWPYKPYCQKNKATWGGVEVPSVFWFRQNRPPAPPIGLRNSEQSQWNWWRLHKVTFPCLWKHLSEPPLTPVHAGLGKSSMPRK